MTSPILESGDAPPAPRRSIGRARNLIEWVVVIGVAVVAAVVIKTFVMQAFYIPSGSMEQTLLINDRVLASKLTYDFGSLERGDIIVYERVESPGALQAGDDDITDLIKRVIGLPGDELVIEGGEVWVNGVALDEPYLAEGVRTENGPLPCPRVAPCSVPEDAVFVMGDNRPNSRDSRWVGYVPASNIVGEAFLRVWPLSRFGGL